MRQKLSKTLKLLVLVLLSFHGNAQKFEWVKFFEGKGSQGTIAMSVDSIGNQYTCFGFQQEIKFDNTTIKDSSGTAGMVCKQDKSGKTIWYQIIRPVVKTIYNTPINSFFNSKGNLIVFVFSESDLIIGSDIVKRKGKTIPNTTALFLIEFDTNGKLINGLHLVEGNIQNDYRQSLFTIDKLDNLYFILMARSRLKVYDSNGVTVLDSNDRENHLLKFSNSGKKFEWDYQIADPFHTNSIKVDQNGDIYLASCWWGQGTLKFAGKTITKPKPPGGQGFIGNANILIWDKNGKEKKWIYVETVFKSTFYDIAVYDSNSLFVSGIYEGDSALFDTIKIKHRKSGCYRFIAMLNSKGKARWVNSEDTTYGGSFHPQANIFCVARNYKDSFFYVSLNMTEHSGKPVIFDGQKYMPGQSIDHGINMKLDARGNILWAFRTFVPLNSMETDDDDNLYFAGSGWIDTIRFGNFKLFPNGMDGFIGKTFDYAIYRGNVYAGPYCAGDSLFVPYTKTGEYADTNIFFAEISDEFGNFTGKEREIGRLKTKENGTIRGTLPMFKVASSHEYRIRIRSTSPQVQSFYKKDKLRLLIYSRDKADPGPPEYICMGDTIQLNTWGGTKWTWSPKYRMNEATLRQPLVWPIRDTIYKIIIADSSGCGAPDTAYKKIYIRQDIKPVSPLNDISICFGKPLNLNALNSDDSLGYTVKWYLNQVLFSKSFALKINTESWFKPDGEKKSLKLVLKNTCSNKMDSISKIITVLASPKAGFSYGVVCDHTKTDFKFTGTIPKTPITTTFNWNFNNEDTSTLENPSYKFAAKGFTTLVLRSSNGCSDSVAKPVIINENPKSDFTYLPAAHGRVDFRASQPNATNYHWLLGNGDSANLTNPNYSYTYNTSLIYTVCLKVIDSVGCQSQTCQQISPSGFKIYPNPNKGRFTVVIDDPASDVSIEIFDMIGQLVKTLEIHPDKISYLIEMYAANGMYLVRVKNGGMIWNQKIVIYN